MSCARSRIAACLPAAPRPGFDITCRFDITGRIMGNWHRTAQDGRSATRPAAAAMVPAPAPAQRAGMPPAAGGRFPGPWSGPSGKRRPVRDCMRPATMARGPADAGSRDAAPTGTGSRDGAGMPSRRNRSARAGSATGPAADRDRPAQCAGGPSSGRALLRAGVPCPAVRGFRVRFEPVRVVYFAPAAQRHGQTPAYASSAGRIVDRPQLRGPVRIN